MPGTKSHSGGSRRNAGRPRALLHLSNKAAHELSIIVLHRRIINPSIRAEDIVSQMIHEDWQELDAQYQSRQEEED